MSITTDSFASGLSLFVLDDSGILFSEAAQEIYELNGSATFIWCRLEEGAAVSEVTLGLTETFGFTEAESGRYLCRMLEEWRGLGFFDPAERPDSAPLSAEPAVPGRRLAPISSPIERCYRVLDREFRIGFPSAEIEALVSPVVAHLRVACGQVGANRITLAIHRDAEGYVIAQSGRLLYRCANEEEIAPYVNFHVFSESLAQAEYDVAFHAGAVSDGKRALILPGGSGSGKTSLTVALLGTGFQYLSDDLLLLRAGRLEIAGVPFSLCVKESGVDLLAPYMPELARLPAHRRPDGQVVRYWPPPAGSYPGSGGMTARWIVFPVRDKPHAGRLEAMSRGEALRRLFESTVTLSRPLTRLQIETLVRWLRNLDCYELSAGSLESDAALLQGLWMQE